MDSKSSKSEVIPRIPFETRTSFRTQKSQTIDEFLMVPEEKPSDENPKAFFKILQIEGFNIWRF